MPLCKLWGKSAKVYSVYVLVLPYPSEFKSTNISKQTNLVIYFNILSLLFCVMETMDILSHTPGSDVATASVLPCTDLTQNLACENHVHQSNQKTSSYKTVRTAQNTLLLGRPFSQTLPKMSAAE